MGFCELLGNRDALGHWGRQAPQETQESPPFPTETTLFLYQARRSAAASKATAVLYIANTSGIETPLGQGWQYPQVVQGTGIRSRKKAAARSTKSISFLVIELGRTEEATAAFSRT